MRHFLFALGFALVTGLTLTAAIADEPASAPTTHPAEPAEVVAGRDDARRDLAAGKLKTILVIPEAFELEWMDPGSDDSNLVTYYEAVLREKYHIELETTVMLPGPNAQALHARGYNAVTDAVIDARFGPDATTKAWKAACDVPKAERQKFIDAHPKPTTGPAK